MLQNITESLDESLNEKRRLSEEQERTPETLEKERRRQSILSGNSLPESITRRRSSVLSSSLNPIRDASPSRSKNSTNPASYVSSFVSVSRTIK